MTVDTNDRSSKALTPTERRIMDVLKDGAVHLKEELYAQLTDELAGSTAVSTHISRIRRKIEGQGLLIVYQETKRGSTFRLARMIDRDDE